MRAASSQRLEPLESRQLYASDGAVVVTMPSSFIDYTMPIGSALVSIHVAPASPVNARASTASASSSPGRTSKTAAPRDRDDGDEDDKAEGARAAGASFASSAAVDHGEPTPAAHHLASAPVAVDVGTPTSGAVPAPSRKATVGPIVGHSQSTFSVLTIAEAASADVVQHTLATAAAAMPFVVAANGVIRQSLQGLVASPMQPAAMRYFFERVQAQSAIGQSIERFILECAQLPRSVSTPPRSRLAAWVVTAGVLMIDVGVALIIVRRRRRQSALRPAMLARRARIAAGL